MLQDKSSPNCSHWTLTAVSQVSAGSLLAKFWMSSGAGAALLFSRHQPRHAATSEAAATWEVTSDPAKPAWAHTRLLQASVQPSPHTVRHVCNGEILCKD